jgi:hypothetical protein
MTERKFTPPTEFPAEYVTGDGRKAVILGQSPDKQYPLIGWIGLEDGCVRTSNWTNDGCYYEYPEPHEADLHDLPKKQVHWASDYGGFYGGSWFDTREEADKVSIPNRIAVIRREWIEGQPPQYFVEEV